MQVDASARRNFKKSERLGYRFRRIDYNQYLDDIRDIWTSTPVRQGVLPTDMLEGRVKPIQDPPSRTAYQDYLYHGIFKGDKLVAYSGCLVTGQLCSLNDLWGHAQYMEDGVVPRVIMETARELIKGFPTVKFYSYGTYFGAAESMRRFKRKFLFMPHRVKWILGNAPECQPSGAGKEMPLGAEATVNK
jgi:hypothetical protein